VASIKVLGVLNGQDMPEPALLAWAQSADLIYAADGGAEKLLRNGLKPIVVGDLDSLDLSLLAPDIRVVEDKGQDNTDCDKLLNLAAKDGVTAITLIGLEGDRLDHVLGSLFSLVGRRKSVRLGLRTGIGIVAPCGSSLSIPAERGRTFSVIPLTLCWGVTLAGAKWELKDAELRPGLHASISNVALDSPTLVMEGGTCLVIVQRRPDELPDWS
jgi:thiamine pyrophosphokinase